MMESMNLSNLQLGGENAVELVVIFGMKSPGMLRRLDLENNFLEDRDGVVLCRDVLERNPLGLDKVNLRMNAVGWETTKRLAELVTRPDCALVSLNLSMNRLGHGAGFLGHALKSGLCCLKELNLEATFLTRESILVIVGGLRMKNGIRYLNLANNFLDHNIAKLIGEVLEVNQTLQTLDLSVNNLDIDENGASYIANGLMENRTLKTLLLEGNEIGMTSAATFVTMLRKNKTLTCLDVQENDGFHGLLEEVDRALSESETNNRQIFL